MKLIFAHDHIFYKYNNQFYSTGGLSKEILERYTKLFDEVIVISRQKKIDTFKNNLTLASTERVRFIKIPNFKSMGNSFEIFKAKKIINFEMGKCDALIARLPSSIGSLAVISAKKFGKPYLIEMVACPWDALWNHSMKGKLLAPFTLFSTKKFVKKAKYVLYVTNEFLQKRYPTNGKSANCSNVSLTEFDISILEKRLKKIEEGDDHKIVLGTTATIDVKYKGQQYVIEALGILKKIGYSNFEYQLVGNGDLTYLKSICKKFGVLDQVKFLGPKPHNEVFEWLDEIDVYVQPSLQEGLPRALVEAMSRGLPAFGAKTGGIPELLDSEFIYNKSTAMIDEICKLLLKFNKKIMLEQAKRNYLESKKYDKNIIEARRQEFFKDFINSENPLC